MWWRKSLEGSSVLTECLCLYSQPCVECQLCVAAGQPCVLLLCSVCLWVAVSIEGGMFIEKFHCELQQTHFWHFRIQWAYNGPIRCFDAYHQCISLTLCRFLIAKESHWITMALLTIPKLCHCQLPAVDWIYWHGTGAKGTYDVNNWLLCNLPSSYLLLTRGPWPSEVISFREWPLKKGCSGTTWNHVHRDGSIVYTSSLLFGNKMPQGHSSQSLPLQCFTMYIRLLVVALW